MDLEKFTKIIWIAATAALVMVVAGFWFDTDPNPSIAGKYSAYSLVRLGLISLSGYFLVLFLRFLITPQAVGSAGNRRTIPFRKKLAVAIVLFLAGFISFEGLLQMQLQNARTNEFAKRQKKAANFDPFLQVAPARNHDGLRINSWGFRGEEIDLRKPPNAYRIFAIGGSTVLCSRVGFEQSWPRLVEKELRRLYPAVDVEVQNAGMHWHTSQHSVMKLLFNIQDFDPDLIVVFHAINDLYRSCMAERLTKGPYRDDYGHYLGPIAPMVREYFAETEGPRILSPGRISAFFRDHWLTDFRDVSSQAPKSRLAEISVDNWPSLRAFDRNMTSLAMLAKSMNIRLIMASQPFLYRRDLEEAELAALWFPGGFCGIDDSQPDIPSMIKGMKAFNETSKRIAESHDVPFIDLEKSVPKSLDYFLDDVHYTEKGNRVVAETIAQNIAAANYIAGKAPTTN